MKLLFCDNSLKELVNFRGDVIENFLDKDTKSSWLLQIIKAISDFGIG